MKRSWKALFMNNSIFGETWSSAARLERYIANIASLGQFMTSACVNHTKSTAYCMSSAISWQTRLWALVSFCPTEGEGWEICLIIISHVLPLLVFVFVFVFLCVQERGQGLNWCTYSQALPFLVFVFFSHLRKAAAISVKTILSSSSKLRQYETKAKEGECARMVNLFISLSLFLAQKKEDLGGRMTQSPRKVSPPIPLFLCLLFIAKKKEAQRHKTNRRWKGSGRLVKSFLVPNNCLCFCVSFYSK